MNGISYLDMKEVAERLKMKSVDAAARWCLSKNISIMILGNKRVVSEFEFRLSYDLPTIDMLKKKYGEEWLDYYEVYKNEDFQRYHELKQGGTNPVQRQSGFNAENFLNDLGYGKSTNS